VVYGMRAEDLVFWIDVLPERVGDDAPVLCLRHADSMVVPRGWTLDDLRDPHLHLFRPPLQARTPRSRERRPTRERVVTQQLELGADVEPSPVVDLIDGPANDGGVAPDVGTDASSHAPSASSSERDASSLDADKGPWSPAFDEADDLNGLLSAQSPLLSRAFRTAERTAE
jgi:hypothetical protein